MKLFKNIGEVEQVLVYLCDEFGVSIEDALGRNLVTGAAKPVMANRRYSKTDKARINKGIKEGKTNEQIAKEEGRTVKAIEVQRSKFNNGK